jgi:hypothetical protein
MHLPRNCLGLLLLLALLAGLSGVRGEEKPELRWEMKEFTKDLTVGYATILVDINNDGKPDIVVVDSQRVLWYENPTWKAREIIKGITKPDNVCIAAYDITGDGTLALALGADWKPFNTKSGGTLQWLKRGKTLEEPWTVHEIGEEPTVHRIRWVDLDGTGKKALVVGPLMGRDSTAKANWTDGQPVRIVAYRIPKEPTKDRWPMEVLNQEVHVMHNFWPVSAGLERKGEDILTASYDGVHRLHKDKADGPWQLTKLGVGNQDNPKSNRGASEIKMGKFKDGTPYIATIEPWHGNQVVVYTPTKPGELWKRTVLDDKLKWGHAVSCADLDGDGDEELVIGVRDNLSNNPGEKCGVRVYKSIAGHWEKWSRQLIDEGGVAVEDLAVADLDGDGRPDIVAVGRATKNGRIYFNRK